MSAQKKVYQKSIDGESYIVSKEILEQQPLEVSSSALKKLREPRPRSEAQKAADKALGERARARWAERKEALQPIKEEIKAETRKDLPVIAELDRKIREEVIKPARERKKKEEEEAKLAAGTHVKVILKRRPRKKVETTETETTDTTDYTETEDDTDMEDYKSKARVARKAQVAKKLVKTVQKIDQVIQQAQPSNPYTAMLASRWR